MHQFLNYFYAFIIITTRHFMHQSFLTMHTVHEAECCTQLSASPSVLTSILLLLLLLFVKELKGSPDNSPLECALFSVR